MRRSRSILVVGADLVARGEAVASLRGRPGTRVVTLRRARPTRPVVRGPIISFARVLAALARFDAGLLRSRWRRENIVVDGGWWDLLVDPLSFEIAPEVLPAARFLSVLAARTDVAIVVRSPASGGLGERRFDPLTIGFKDRWWRQTGPQLARAVVTIAPDDARAAALAIDDAPRPPSAPAAWRSVPVGPPRRDLAAVGPAAARATTALWRPTRPALAAMSRLNAPLLRSRLARPTVEPVEGLRDLCEAIGLRVDSIAAMRSHSDERVVAAIVTAQHVHAFVKVGPADDLALRREADLLSRMSGVTRTFSVPTVLHAGEWRDWFVVATQAVAHRTRPRRLAPSDALAICIELATGIDGVGRLTHGDFAPWNLLVTERGKVVLDWEGATPQLAPMADLCLFVVRRGAILRRGSPSDAAGDLVSPGRTGWRYLEAIGEAPERARDLVVELLRTPSPEPDVGAFERAMLDVLTHR